MKWMLAVWSCVANLSPSNDGVQGRNVTRLSTIVEILKLSSKNFDLLLKNSTISKKISGHHNNNHEADRPLFLWVDKDLLLLDKQGRRPLELMDWVEGRMGIVFRTWALSTKYFFEKLLGRVPIFFFIMEEFKTIKNQWNRRKIAKIYFENRDGTAGGKSQIVRTPLRVKHVSAGKPDWIFFLFSIAHWLHSVLV